MIRTASAREASPRHYLMCPPEHFEVRYAINPWMDPGTPVDRARALAQWEGLVACYRALGHTVDVLAPEPGLADMVYAANGATVVGGRVLGARFAFAEREPEAVAHRAWFTARGWADVGVPVQVNEGEGDFAVTGRWLLAGHGFRSSPLAPAEAQEYFGRPAIGLELVDPRFYHLDTALAVLDAEREEVVYFPGAFSPGSRAVLAALFPDALLASEADALVLGLNAVSDGRHVVLPREARGLFGPLRERGFDPVGAELGELVKGGGSVKCCTQELRPAPVQSSVPPPASSASSAGGHASPQSMSRAAR
ncbi:dimethylargininase [Streptomyces sp. NPDC088925]|uniref:dimethylargininase n=1 Tax=Streptomyces sp. NPDC088925 TaxID=3365914 RepID=UPI00381B10BA